MKAIFISYLTERHHRDFLEGPAIGWPTLLKYFPYRSSVVRLLLINTLWSDSSFVVIPLFHLPPLSPPPPRHHTQSLQSRDVSVMSVCWPHSQRHRCSRAGETAPTGRFCELLVHRRKEWKSDKKQSRAEIKSVEYKGTLLHTHRFFYLPFCRSAAWMWLEFLGCSSRILQLSNVKKFLQLAALNFLGSYYRFSTCFIAVTVDNLPVVGRSVGYGSGGLILSLSSLYFFDTVCYTTKTTAKWSNASRLC